MSIEIKDGAVEKDGKHVGTLGADGTFTPAEGIHPRTVTAMRKRLADFAQAPAGETGATSDEAANTDAGSAIAPGEEAAAPGEGGELSGEGETVSAEEIATAPEGEANTPKSEAAPEALAPKERKKAPQGPEERNRAPKGPEPMQSGQYGDLTPAYVEWYRENHTAAEFAAKYQHRGIK